MELKRKREIKYQDIWNHIELSQFLSAFPAGVLVAFLILITPLKDTQLSNSERGLIWAIKRFLVPWVDHLDGIYTKTINWEADILKMRYVNAIQKYMYSTYTRMNSHICRWSPSFRVAIGCRKVIDRQPEAKNYRHAPRDNEYCLVSAVPQALVDSERHDLCP